LYCSSIKTASFSAEEESDSGLFAFSDVFDL
jgi:hypothetical protein